MARDHVSDATGENRPLNTMVGGKRSARASRATRRGPRGRWLIRTHRPRDGCGFGGVYITLPGSGEAAMGVRNALATRRRPMRLIRPAVRYRWLAGPILGLGMIASQ